jgi:hypothetical protein
VSAPAVRHETTSARTALLNRGDARRRHRLSGFPARPLARAETRRRVIAPELTGLEPSAATARLRAHGLSPVCQRLEVAGVARTGQVVAQIPTAGSAMAADEAVALLVAVPSGDSGRARKPSEREAPWSVDEPGPAKDKQPPPLPPIAADDGWAAPTETRSASTCVGGDTRIARRRRVAAVLALMISAVGVGVAVETGPDTPRAHRRSATGSDEPARAQASRRSGVNLAHRADTDSMRVRATARRPRVRAIARSRARTRARVACRRHRVDRRARRAVPLAVTRRPAVAPAPSPPAPTATVAPAAPAVSPPAPTPVTTGPTPGGPEPTPPPPGPEFF